MRWREILSSCTPSLLIAPPGSSGMAGPVKQRIVGAVRRGGPDYTIVAFDVLADGEAVVIQTHWTEVFWSQENAALAQSELGEAPDL